MSIEYHAGMPSSRILTTSLSNRSIDKDAFFKSLFGDLHVSVGPATIIAYYQDSDAAILTDVLPHALVVAMKHLRQRSLELDADRTTYEPFESRSPQETKPIRGHIFRMYAKGKKDSSGNPGDKLYIGMSFSKIVRLLGKPSGVNPGTEMLEAGPHGEVVASEETRAQLARTEYCMWKRPEGTYLLVIEDGKLASIYRKP